jgi:hypothetical protein
MFCRLGLHVRPEEVVRALAEQGFHVGVELVRRVRFEMQRGGVAVGEQRPVPSGRPAVRRLPKGFPQRGEV